MIFERLCIFSGRCSLASSPESHVISCCLRAENFGHAVSSIVIVDECISTVTISIVMGVFGIEGANRHYAESAGHYF
jgi:hypothetical protein